MSKSYNHIAGQSVERLAALSDGLFAVAMTLLVLDLHVPTLASLHSESDLLQELLALAPHLVIYFMSFLTIGIFWVGQQTQLNYLKRSDRHLTWIHLVFLFMVSLMPFSTSLMTEYIGLRTALIVYWLNILFLGLALLTGWCYANTSSLLKEEVTPEMNRSIRNRILIAQALYALGALLCMWSTSYSIAFIIAVQLNYAIAPHFKIASDLSHKD